MTPELIDELSKEYAESEFPLTDYFGEHWDNQRRIDAMNAKSVLEWLHKKYFIVESTRVLNEYNRLENDRFISARADDYDYSFKMTAQLQELEHIFGAETFSR